MRARAHRPAALAGLRKAIARDIAAQACAPPRRNRNQRASRHPLGAIDSLPLAMEVRPPAPAPATGGAADDSAWVRFARELWRDLRDLVRIQNMERPELPLLAPAQAYFLRENFKLRLLSARLALLAHDEKSFHADLKAARDWLTRYYDTRAKTVANAVSALSQLHDSQIGIELPDVAASLDAVRDYRLTRERGR